MRTEADTDSNAGCEDEESEDRDNPDAIRTHLLIQQNGANATFVRTDVGHSPDMENLVRVAVETYGRLDM